MTTPNTYANVSALANPMQQDALFVIREQYRMQSLVTMLTDMNGLNPRKGYEYNQAVATDVGEADDLTSSAFAPADLATLTPKEIGLQFFVTDSRAESQLPESIISDGALELGLAAGDKIEADILSNFASLTGGTIGTAGSTITWGYVSAAIAQARNASKSASAPIVGVIHGYQAAVLAKTASVAGATSLAQAPNFTDGVTSNGLGPVFMFMGVPIYQVFAAPDSGDDFRGAVFQRSALAIDWRRPIRIEPERDASRRGTEFNMSAVYAHGVWRAKLGVQMIFDASAPTS
jgi:hypothetical protein